MTDAHAVTALLMALLAVTLGARLGIPRDRSRWSSLFFWSLVPLIAMVGVGFFARALSGDAFQWFHGLILAALVAALAIGLVDTWRTIGRTRRTTPHP